MKDASPSLHFQSGCILYSKWVSWRRHMDGSCHFIQSATLCRFMGAFRPFTLRVIIDRYVFIDIILPLKSFFLSLYFCSMLFLGFFLFYRTPLNISCSVGLVLHSLLSLAGLGNSLSLIHFECQSCWIKYSWLHVLLI